MGNLTKNLSRYEFACRCGCGFDTADFELVEALQGCVDHFTNELDTVIRIDITGPNRCKEHNKSVGGAPDSQHIYARAADFKLFDRRTNKQIDSDLVADYLELEYQDRFGIGRYSSRTHLDTRTIGPARWSKQ